MSSVESQEKPKHTKLAAWLLSGGIILSLIGYGSIYYSYEKSSTRTQEMKQENIIARDISALMTEGHSLLVNEDYVQAEKVFGILLQRDPKNKRALLESGIAAYHQKKMDSSSGKFSKVVELAGKEPRGSDIILVSAAHYYLGLIFQSEKKPELALIAFKKALSYDAGNSDILIAEAKIEIERNHNTEALALLKDAVQLQPRSRESYELLERVYSAIGDKEAASNAKKAASDLPREKGQ